MGYHPSPSWLDHFHRGIERASQGGGSSAIPPASMAMLRRAYALLGFGPTAASPSIPLRGTSSTEAAIGGKAGPMGLESSEGRGSTAVVGLLPSSRPSALHQSSAVSTATGMTSRRGRSDRTYRAPAAVAATAADAEVDPSGSGSDEDSWEEVLAAHRFASVRGAVATGDGVSGEQDDGRAGSTARAIARPSRFTS